MAAHHIGEQTHCQRCRFGENAEYLDHLHDRNREFKPHGHIRPEYLFPIMLAGKQVGGKECEQSQYHGHGYVAGKISPAGKYNDKPQQIHYKDEHEHCQ